MNKEQKEKLEQELNFLKESYESEVITKEEFEKGKERIEAKLKELGISDEKDKKSESKKSKTEKKEKAAKKETQENRKEELKDVKEIQKEETKTEKKQDDVSEEKIPDEKTE